jgi:predicted lipase
MPGKAPAMGQNLSCFTEAAEVLGATMKRQDAIALMRIAGYHSDSRSFARLFLENRVNKATADEAYVKGQQQRSAGMGCHCFKCKEAQQQQLPSNPR